MRNFNSQDGMFKPILRIKITPESSSILRSRRQNVQSRVSEISFDFTHKIIFLLRIYFNAILPPPRIKIISRGGPICSARNQEKIAGNSLDMP